jgi:phenylalanyl-tRNA synthetase beta chain
MLVSIRWLEEILGAPLDPERVAVALTELGLEVEAVQRCGAGLDPVLVAGVVAVAPHPTADHLHLVDVVAGADPVRVVCGAANVPPPGGKVAWAPVGTTLPRGVTLAAREIRGQRSLGMLCAEDELDLGTDHAGIMVLPDDWKPGERLVDRIPGAQDVVLDLSVTPNRPDALGHLGIARELAAKLDLPFPRPAPGDPPGPPAAGLVHNRAPARCGRYVGVALDGARIAPSPTWLRVRLHRVGLRPINNAVDVTNFVLMETGQPLHAFDRDSLGEGRVVVRLAEEGEAMTALDGTALTLSADDLVIADAQVPQALAGVMGGASSRVEEGASRLLLEAAWFAPSPIRRTARRHGLHTDSSHRFERGVDPGAGLAAAARRAVELLRAVTGAEPVGVAVVGGECPEPARIVLRPARIRRQLGVEIPAGESKRILSRLEVEVDAENAEAWACRPPTHRPDLEIEDDLVEEVLRHWGLDRLPAVPSQPTELHLVPPDPAAELADRVADALVEAGAHEHVSLCFDDPARAEPFAGGAGSAGPPVRIGNPMRSQHAILRVHVLPGLLDAVRVNAARHARQIRLFEVGRIYGWGSGSARGDPAGERRPGSGPATARVDAVLPTEPVRAGLLLAERGPSAPQLAHAVAGALTRALRRIGHRGRVRPDPAAGAAWLHPGVRAAIVVDDRVVGLVGELHPELHRSFDLPPALAVAYGELWLERVPLPRAGTHVELPTFPATSRDVSIDLGDVVAVATAIDHLERAAAEVPPLADPSGAGDPPRLAPGDVGRDPIDFVEAFRGRDVADGRRAVLLRCHYRARGRSVTDAEVQALHDEIVARACRSLSALDPHVRTR